MARLTSGKAWQNAMLKKSRAENKDRLGMVALETRGSQGMLWAWVGAAGTC